MTKLDTLVMGLIIAMLISITHFSLTMGVIFGTMLFLINLADTKKPVGRDWLMSKDDIVFLLTMFCGIGSIIINLYLIIKEKFFN